jgi:hypothetical protein
VGRETALAKDEDDDDVEDEEEEDKEEAEEEEGVARFFPFPPRFVRPLPTSSPSSSSRIDDLLLPLLNRPMASRPELSCAKMSSVSTLCVVVIFEVFEEWRPATPVLTKKKDFTKTKH